MPALLALIGYLLVALAPIPASAEKHGDRASRAAFMLANPCPATGCLAADATATLSTTCGPSVAVVLIGRSTCSGRP
jgi:hypothetical protein